MVDVEHAAATAVEGVALDLPPVARLSEPAGRSRCRRARPIVERAAIDGHRRRRSAAYRRSSCSSAGLSMATRYWRSRSRRAAAAARRAAASRPPRVRPPPGRPARAPRRGRRRAGTRRSAGRRPRRPARREPGPASSTLSASRVDHLAQRVGGRRCRRRRASTPRRVTCGTQSPVPTRRPGSARRGRCRDGVRHARGPPATGTRLQMSPPSPCIAPCTWSVCASGALHGRLGAREVTGGERGLRLLEVRPRALGVAGCLEERDGEQRERRHEQEESQHDRAWAVTQPSRGASCDGWAWRQMLSNARWS